MPTINEAQRPAKLTLIIGTNGTGKTTVQKNILEELYKNDPENFKALIVCPDPIEWTECEDVELSEKSDFVFRGVRRHIYNPKVTLKELHRFVRGYLMLDDCRAYLKASTADDIHALLVRRRQRMVDVFAVAHGFNEIPPVFFTFASDIILFRTTDNIAKRRDCLKDYDTMRLAQARINKKAENNPHYFEHIKFS